MQQTASAKQATATEHGEVLRLARKRFQAAIDGENDSRKQRLADKQFAAGDHWPENIKKQREDDKRPCLVIDRLKPQIKQVTNQQRQMRPAVQVIPGKGASKETAEVFQGLIRHVETSSDADDAYDQAGKDQVETGLGWYRFRTEYCDDNSGDQKIVIERIRNPFSVYPDPAAVRRDRSDGKFLFSTSDFLEDELKARYPQAKLALCEEFSGLGDDALNWLIGDDRIRVAEYWTVETTKTEKTLTNGRTRKVETRKVKCYIITGLEVLQSFEWAGKYIPFVPVLGEEIDINGKVDLRGMVRGAKDPQRMFNYWKSASTEAMALAPKAPFLVAEGQIEKYIKMWQNANIKNLPYLIYTPKTLGDQLAPPPQRQVAEPPIQAMLAETQGAENDIRAATGFFDTNQRETREMSGVAIRTRMQQGEHGNSDYIDNLARAVRFGGRQLVDVIPKIYDVARVVRILGLDNKPKTVVVHSGQENAPEPQVDPSTGQPGLPEGVAGIYDLSVGEYDVEVNAGRDAGTARQEFVDVMQELFKANPALFQIVGDLFFENMDVPNAQQVAERLKKTLPPGLNDDPNAEAQAQVGQLQQQMQLMQAALQQAQQEIATKKAELDSKERIAQAEIESKEKIAVMQADVAKHKAAIDGGLEQMRLEAENARHVASEGREAASQQLEHAHQARAAEHAAVQAVESQHSEHQHASKMQASKPEKAA